MFTRHADNWKRPRDMTAYLGVARDNTRVGIITSGLRAATRGHTHLFSTNWPIDRGPRHGLRPPFSTVARLRSGNIGSTRATRTHNSMTSTQYSFRDTSKRSFGGGTCGSVILPHRIRSSHLIEESRLSKHLNGHLIEETQLSELNWRISIKWTHKSHLIEQSQLGEQNSVNSVKTTTKLSCFNFVAHELNYVPRCHFCEPTLIFVGKIWIKCHKSDVFVQNRKALHLARRSTVLFTPDLLTPHTAI